MGRTRPDIVDFKVLCAKEGWWLLEAKHRGEMDAP